MEGGTGERTLEVEKLELKKPFQHSENVDHMPAEVIVYPKGEGRGGGKGRKVGREGKREGKGRREGGKLTLYQTSKVMLCLCL